ncbi:MAG: hypothetical protein JEZ06_21805 [Anaerolineaceae bacterium]|nr:hypothetical protein [Anaerolineaceae bacterium]
MQIKRFIYLLILFGLTACTKAVSVPIQSTSTSEPSNTTTQPVSTMIADTPTSIPETATPAFALTPSPYPTFQFAYIPNVEYIERWEEFQDALAGTLISYVPLENAFCEWEILGEVDTEIYVWAVCEGYFIAGEVEKVELLAGADTPAVIHINENGSIEQVEIPKGGNLYTHCIRDMFPDDIEERIISKQIDYQRLADHLKWRLENSEEPPLIVLFSTSMSPTQIKATESPNQQTLEATAQMSIPQKSTFEAIPLAEINEIITRYFDLRYQELSISPSKDFENNNFGDVVSTRAEADDFLTSELEKLAVEKKYYELKKLRYVEYSYVLNYKKMIVDKVNQTAEVEVSEEFEIICERAIEYDSKNPRTCAVGELTHEIILQKENDQWKIISDIYWDAWWRGFRTPDSSTEDVLQKIELLQNQLELTAMSAMQPTAAKSTETPTPVPATATPNQQTLEATAQMSIPLESTYEVIPLEPEELVRWPEYEQALGAALFERLHFLEPMCEWQALGRDESKLYLFAACSGYDQDEHGNLNTHGRYVVVYLQENGNIERVGTTGNTPGTWQEVNETLYPPEIR